MTRLKLFLLFAAMAWASLVDPHHGQLFVDDAEEGAAVRCRRALIADIHRHGRGPRPAPPSLWAPVFAILAMAACAGWVTFLTVTVLGWLE